MSTVRTRQTRMVLSVVTVGLVAMASSAGAQTMGDLLAQQGFSWMMGTWTTTSDDGQKAQLTFKWAIKDHVGGVEFTSGDGFKLAGIIFMKQAEEKVVMVAADNRGGVWQGEWGSDGYRAILKVENTKPYGETDRAAFAYSWVDKKTMKVEMYGLQQNGQMLSEPAETATFTRKVKQKVNEQLKQKVDKQLKEKR